MSVVFMTNDKRNMVDLTMKEVLDEYSETVKRFGQEFSIYLSIPVESAMKNEYQGKVETLHEVRNKLAIVIADRLTQ